MPQAASLMPAIAATDLARMRDALLFDGPERGRKLSRNTLRAALNADGLKSTSVQLELEPVNRVDLPGS